jgi:hypothetical protein
MKAKKVYEFQQGGNPYDTMNIGSHRKFTEENWADLVDHHISELVNHFNGEVTFNEELGAIIIRITEESSATYLHYYISYDAPGEILVCSDDQNDAEQFSNPIAMTNTLSDWINYDLENDENAEED